MIQTQTNAANVFTDLNGLQDIRKLGKEDKGAALMEVAKQFESMFIGMMLSSMRDAGKVFSEDNMFSSPESDFYQNMYDDQMSVSLTAGQGTGLAEVIHRQLMVQYGENGEEKPLDFSKLNDRRQSTSLAYAIKKVDEELEQIKEDSSAAASANQDAPNSENTTAIVASGVGSKGQQFATPAEFVAALYPLAEKVGGDLGVDPKAIVAQAALETGWGKYMIADEKGNTSHNLFGIKADSRWDGSKVEVTTHEFRNGVRVNERAEFRSYASLEEGVQDYANFLRSASRYQDALDQQLSAGEYGHALQQSGYATDPQYGAKIERISDSELLNAVLKQALNNSPTEISSTATPSAGE